MIKYKRANAVLMKNRSYFFAERFLLILYNMLSIKID